MQWDPGCRLPWKPRYRIGESICWEGKTPAQIWLAPGRSYAVQYTLNVCAALPAVGNIFLRQSPYEVFTDAMPLRFSVEGGRQTLHYAAVLHPGRNTGCGAELSLVLDGGAPLCVERAMMDVVEL